jgi:hypothetical protein
MFRLQDRLRLGRIQMHSHILCPCFVLGPSPSVILHLIPAGTAFGVRMLSCRRAANLALPLTILEVIVIPPPSNLVTERSHLPMERFRSAHGSLFDRCKRSDSAHFMSRVVAMYIALTTPQSVLDAREYRLRHPFPVRSQLDCNHRCSTAYHSLAQPSPFLRPRTTWDGG